MNLFLILIKNIRPYRSIHYAGLVIGGALISSWVFTIPFDAPGTFLVSISIILAFQSACVVNDFFDLEADAISNPKRPLVAKSVPPKVYRDWGLLCLFSSLILGISAGWVPFAFISLFHILYTVYSVPPFKLKRYFPVNTAIIASNGLIAMVAGFSILGGKETALRFPLRIAAMVMVSLLTSINMIHIKDREADIRVGVRTIPSMMSEKNSRIIIGGLTIIAYFSVPLILKIDALLLPSAIGAALGCFWLFKKRWREAPYFVTYFTYYIIMFYFIGINIRA